MKHDKPVPKTHKKVKVVPKAVKTANSARKFDLLYSHEPALSQDTLQELRSIEPLLAQRSKAAVKFHANDLAPEDQKIRDAQKLLEYVKVLQVPKKKEIQADVKVPIAKLKSTVAEKPKDKKKAKDSVKKNTKSSKSHVSKAKSKPKGVKLENLSKTITYKNRKYKITPVVDWEKISKMLEALGYKAVHIVGMKDKHIQSGLKEHLEKHGIHKVNKDKGSKLHAATESFVSAVHRHKTWRNSKQN